ncbi:DJ-1/PfpI family protein [Lacrimispora amygdalina]|uniref:DJ-1/PfpI family protein n=1 Tax=Lacrimispora amygdalina TaxID=253257 RepID=UPI000BE3098A|nr:DJ-1/PfpI family protein [Lacrimispora amygdalina]
MNTCIYLYQETSFFEVDLVAYFMKTVGNVNILADDKSMIETNEGVRIVVDLSINEISAEEIDVLVICGGNTDNINKLSELNHLIRECKKIDKVIGGICAGRDIVAEALCIEANSHHTQTLDGNIVLSPGNEYVDFALAIGKAANIYKDEADYQETITYFKLFKNPAVTI